MNDYKTSVEIKRPKADVFKAISEELVKWWGHQDQPVTENGIVFKVSWGEPWYQFEVIKFTNNHLMVWECIDSNQIINGLDGVQKEWVGTKVHWKLTELSTSCTRLDFMHEGLIPEFICFDVCSSAWSDFLQQHLVSYLEFNE